MGERTQEDSFGCRLVDKLVIKNVAQDRQSDKMKTIKTLVSFIDTKFDNIGLTQSGSRLRMCT